MGGPQAWAEAQTEYAAPADCGRCGGGSAGEVAVAAVGTRVIPPGLMTTPINNKISTIATYLGEITGKIITGITTASATLGHRVTKLLIIVS